MANSAATDVPGRNAIVTAAMVFIAVESSLLAEASVRESSATATPSLASCWDMRWNSCVRGRLATSIEGCNVGSRGMNGVTYRCQLNLNAPGEVVE